MTRLARLIERSPCLELVGGKAESLLVLSEAGLLVPPFCTIPYDRLSGVSITPELTSSEFTQISLELEFASDPFSRRVLAASLREALVGNQLAADVEGILRSWVSEHQKLSPLTFVRSSAAGEDSAAASGAGQYETVVSKTTEGELRSAVQRVVASYYLDRAVEYRRATSQSQQGPRMAAILQEALYADYAGVVFGCDPLSGNSDVLVIEAVVGLGTTLVSGAVRPQRYLLRKSDGFVFDSSVGCQHWRDCLSFDGKIFAEGTEGTALIPDSIEELWRSYLRVEEVFQSPQDVEWAMCSGRVWLLQSRPIVEA